MKPTFITEEARDGAAKSVFEHWKFQVENGAKPVSWVERGNSDKQTEARAYANAALLAALPHIEKAIREDCAKAAEAELLESTPDNEADQAYNQAVHDCAAAIRARKE